MILPAKIRFYATTCSSTFHVITKEPAIAFKASHTSNFLLIVKTDTIMIE